MSNIIDISEALTASSDGTSTTPDPEPQSPGSLFLDPPINYVAVLADLLERNVEWDATEEGMEFWLDVHERLTRIATKGG